MNNHISKPVSTAKLRAVVVVLAVVAATLGVGVGPAHAQIADPGTLQNVADVRVGQTLDIVVTGRASGLAWGTDVYTADSQIAVAAVHAGVVIAGQTATVQVEVLPGAARYQASTRNGVTTNRWGAYDLSYRFVTTTVGGLPAFADPAVLGVLAPYVGQVFYFRIQGSTAGNVWGSGPYTTDSSLARAAVHAGALDVGETGLLKVTIVDGQASYQGSARNGITSASWGAYGSGFELEAATGSHYLIQYAAGSADQLSGATEGVTISVFVVGRSDAPVWGSGPYTADSDVGAAAVHAGLVRPGEVGIVTVHLSAGRASYAGSTSNDVTSFDWGAYGLSFEVTQ